MRSAKEQAAILEEVREGRVDIVVGTHRLLQDDVRFKELGLVVVDEEHRFGVRHKERLKNLRAEVDLVTLTATPIPRTLNMSLAGLRDLPIHHCHSAGISACPHPHLRLRMGQRPGRMRPASASCAAAARST